jgi:myosin-crossreactive antigen
MDKKLNKYESFVKMNIEDLMSENVDFSLFERPENDISVDMARRSNDVRAQYLIPLDF